MEGAVLDWNKPAIGFYERLGPRLRKGCMVTRLARVPLARTVVLDIRTRGVGTLPTPGPSERPPGKRFRESGASPVGQPVLEPREQRVVERLGVHPAEPQRLSVHVEEQDVGFAARPETVRERNPRH